MRPDTTAVRLGAHDLTTANIEPSAFVTIGEGAEQKWWNDCKEISPSILSALFLTHDIRADKAGACFVPATLHEGRRQLRYVHDVTLLVFDIDGGQSLDDAIAALEATGLHAWLYTSHSHRSTQSEVVVAHYERWAKKANQPETPTAESLARYFADKKKERANVKLGSHNGFPYKNVPGKVTSILPTTTR